MIQNSPGRSDEYIGGQHFGTSLQENIGDSDGTQTKWVAQAREFKHLHKLLFTSMATTHSATSRESPNQSHRNVPYTDEALSEIRRVSQTKYRNKPVFDMLHLLSPVPNELDPRILAWRGCERQT